jgi:hypothetical protein
MNEFEKQLRTNQRRILDAEFEQFQLQEPELVKENYPPGGEGFAKLEIQDKSEVIAILFNEAKKKKSAKFAEINDNVE